MPIWCDREGEEIVVRIALLVEKHRRTPDEGEGRRIMMKDNADLADLLRQTIWRGLSPAAAAVLIPED